MRYELTLTTMERKGGLKVETVKHIAVRDESEVQERFHDMRLGEIRDLGKGYHLTRIE